MQRAFLLSACLLAAAGFLPLAARSDGAPSAPTGTPPPQIYHVVTTAMCARLHEKVRPAVAMILQNDQQIAKSPPLFKMYMRGTLTSSQTNDSNGRVEPSNNDSIYNSTPETSMALQRMSYLVIPIARNLISAQTLLDDAKLLDPTGNPADDATLAQIKKQLLETIAFQSASLDIINGFVQTQQMGEIQHAGQEYIDDNNRTEEYTKPVQATPNPWQDPNTPGITQNPYVFDVTSVPGLAVGYNPLTSVVNGLAWLQGETQTRENAAGSTLTAALAQCGK